MHYKFFIRLLKNNPYLASTDSMKNLIPPVCQRFYRTHTSAVNKKIPFHSSVMFCSLSLLGVGVLREKKAATGTISNMSSPTEFDNVKVNDQLTTTRNLSALLFKQKFYMNMIDSLEPSGDLNPKEAKVQSEHLKYFYEEFISNQSEIATLVENSSFDHQVQISQKVQQKVRQIQTKMEEITSPVQLATSRNNLSALLFKQKFYMNMIDSFEPTGDLNPNEAKVQSEHLKHFYEEFISNQSEIATLVEKASFDHQVEISQKVDQKVRQIQAKLEEIISPIKTVQTSASSVIHDHFNQTEHLHVISNFLDSIAQKASSLQIKLKRILAPVKSSVPEGVSSGAVKAQTKSSETVSSVPEDVSSDDVEAELESSGSRSYVNQKLDTLIWLEGKVYEEILANIVHSPKAAGSDHLRPFVDNEYRTFLSIRDLKEKQACEYPDILKKIKEMSERVERAVEDYRLYCKGQIPKENFNYLSSKKKAVR